MSPPYISHRPTSDFKTQKEKSFLTAFEKPLKPDPYPPCAVPLKKLKRIYLKDLKSNTHNHGCYVVLRAFGEPVIKPIVINAVEDESGEVGSTSHPRYVRTVSWLFGDGVYLFTTLLCLGIE
ncbi:hypothetical protein D6C99_09137 [Aureobasidium pullulans]|nr:hypothetical protein D6C99_09137 [Aureobasidium pullulans]